MDPLIGRKSHFRSGVLLPGAQQQSIGFRSLEFISPWSRWSMNRTSMGLGKLTLFLERLVHPNRRLSCCVLGHKFNLAHNLAPETAPSDNSPATLHRPISWKQARHE